MPRLNPSFLRTVLGLVLVIAIVGLFVWRFWPAEPGTERLPTVLSGILSGLQSDNPSRRGTARDDSWKLLADPVRSTLGIRTSRIHRVVPAEWFRESGAPVILDALLQHFREGWEEDQVHELLVALVDLYPKACHSAGVGPIRGSLDPAFAQASVDGIAIAREIAAATPLGCYLSYRLERSQSPIRSLTAAAILTGYRLEVAPSVRDRWVRLLRRVADRDLRPIALLNRGGERWIDPKWATLTQDRGLGYRDMDDWCEQGDHDSARRALITSLLGSFDLKSREHGLDRFRWDPLPELDDRVLELATTSDLATRRLALRALAGIPNKHAGRVLIDALDDPQLRNAAISAARSMTGGSFGFVDNDFDMALPPAAYHEAIQSWRQLIERVSPVSVPSKAVGSELEFRAGVQVLSLRVDRGELDRAVAKRAIPRIAARGLSPAASPSLRAATWSTVARWERPPVDVLVRAILSERDATIRTALLDALLQSGKDGVGAAFETALDSITASQKFDGIELTRAYSIAFPDLRLFESLLPALESSESRRRAAAAYLAGGVAVPPAGEQRDKLVALVEQLSDKVEGPRFWAHASLHSLFGDDFGYHADQTESANREAIRQWRARVTGEDGPP